MQEVNRVHIVNPIRICGNITVNSPQSWTIEDVFFQIKLSHARVRQERGNRNVCLCRLIFLLLVQIELTRGAKWTTCAAITIVFVPATLLVQLVIGGVQTTTVSLE